MDKEMAYINKNHTYELVTLSGGKRQIECKLVFVIKNSVSDSKVCRGIRYKAKLMAKGYIHKWKVWTTIICSLRW